ncbi:MAG: 16S rRNA (adenine(1518)-N(6)/adenine(1519)-N(6))-dimethyltransferase RsmA [Patescibacteria group bacterium]|nr:16S rRNA (adenine(1518)-N(6)/adenine(1519)-N(6))-dimethyltransferase RsmA [Patescibacteria group bacterium]
MNLNQLDFLLKKYKLSPNKIRGQNFLIDDEALALAVQAADISADDLVLEVGPGLGALTSLLAERAGQVFAFEVDKNFQKPLAKLQATYPNLDIFWQDILSLDDRQLAGLLEKYNREKYKIVANIPYYLTAKFVRQFISSKQQPQSMTLMLQKEVAQRIVVADNKHSLLSLAVHFYAESKIIAMVGKEKFYPQPKVDSAIVHISDIRPWPYQLQEKLVWQLVHRGFAKKRKKLINNLLTDSRFNKEKISQAMLAADLDINIRAEKLHPSDWLKLAEKLS